MCAQIRLRRSILSVPASREKMFLKALGLPADVIMLDLEDSVPLQEKDWARQQAARYLLQEDWKNKTRACRINGLQTPFAYKDIIRIMEEAGQGLEVMVLPKVESAEQVKAVEIFLQQIEAAMELQKKIKLEACVETAQGMLNCREIAFSSERLEALVFGVADYTASLHMPSKGVSGHGEAEDFYPGDRWHYPMSRLAVCARSAGLQCIDAPYGDYRDMQGLERSCLMSYGLGYDGKWAIHPDQLEQINSMFTPTREEVEQAQRILSAYRDSQSMDRGAMSLDGKMIDAASVRLAEEVCAKWEQIKKGE